VDQNEFTVILESEKLEKVRAEIWFAPNAGVSDAWAAPTILVAHTQQIDERRFGEFLDCVFRS
jgi:hypothetical protein